MSTTTTDACPSGTHPRTPCGCTIAQAASERLDGNLRPVTEVDGILPLKSVQVAVIRYRGGKIAYAKRVGEKRAMAADVRPRDRYVIAWPGEWSQDIFSAPTSFIRERLGAL
jgi:hypothetical protein